MSRGIIRVIGEGFVHYAAPAFAICVALATAVYSWSATELSPRYLTGVSVAMIALAATLLVERAVTLRKVAENTQGLPAKIDRIYHAVRYECERFFRDVRDAPLLTQYLQVAKKEILLVGPTRYSLVEKNLKEQLLEKARNIDVKILIMEEAYVPALSAFMNLPLMGEQQRKACQMFESWRNEVVDSRRKFQVRFYPLLPFSLNIIDGKSDQGKALFILHRCAPDLRPCFEISRKGQPELFEAVYNYYDRLWRAGTDLGKSR